MSTSFAIPATSLSGLAAISPAAFQLLTAGSSATSASIFDSSSSIVQLSALGQVLGTGTTLENSLQALQGNASTATPASVATAAQNFVTAFNNVQQSLGDVQPLLGTLPDSALVSQFSATLNAAAGSAGSGGTAGLGSLQSIGITAAAIQNPGSLPTAGLQIDQNALNAAVANNPGGTLSLLAQATQPLLQQVATFEAQATSTAVSPTDLSVQGTGIATDLLQNLSADTVLNDIQLNNLDLASLGLDANSLQTTGTALSGSLSATLATPAATTSTTDQTGTEVLLANVPTVSLAAATELTPTAGATLTTANAAPTTTPAATPASETPAVATTTADTTASPLTTSTAQATTPLPTSAADTLAADQAVSAATQTLQNLLLDPIVNAINNNLFDPLYSALIAASHQSDFASPMPQIRASAIPAENPAPVFPVAQVRAISDYNRMASGFGRRQGGESRS